MAKKKKKAVKRAYIPFARRLRELGYKSYREYLASDHWISVKKRYRASKRPQECVSCSDILYQLHHTTYERLGREWLKDLIPLCDGCHGKFHRYLKRHKSLKLGDTDIILEAIRKK